MTDEHKLKEFVEFIKENFPEKSIELADALDILNMVFDDIYDLIRVRFNEYHIAQNLTGASSLIEKSKDTLEIKNIILNYKDLLIDELEEENTITEEYTDDDIEPRNCPNYNDYCVDTSIPHTLYEDFTHTKACGFEFCGVRYETKNMRGVLVALCEILVMEDKNKMQNFVHDPTMKGRKVSYFSNHMIIEDDIVKNEKIGDSEIYVWINLSCNQIRNVIRRVIKKYNYKLNDFKIYLRADYTALHKNPRSQSKHGTTTPESSEKIGKYVQSCFCTLENYPFTSDELLAMQSSNWTLKTFGFSIPLLKECDTTKPSTEQIKINGYNRYWKTPYTICGKQYFVTSQWYENQRKKFDDWYYSLNRQNDT